MNSVNKWQSFAIHAYTALPGLEVQISNQLAENLTPHHFFSSLLPRCHVSFTPARKPDLIINYNTARNWCSKQFRSDHADVPLHWHVWPEQETRQQATVFNYGSDEIRRTCLLQNVSGSSALEETDAHKLLGLFASDSHTCSSETTAHLGHLFSICICNQSSREAEQAPWKLNLKE